MKKMFLKSFSLLLMAGSLLLVTSCETDSGGGSTSVIIGEWNIQSASMDIEINDLSLVDYFVDELHYTQAEAEEFADEMTGQMEDMNGTLIIEEGGSYSSFFEGDPEDGTWRLSSDNKTLYIDEDTADEQIFDVLSLTPNRLVIESTQVEPMGDLDMDGIDDEMAIIVQMNFAK